MNDEQQARIAIGAVFFALCPFVPTLICKLLGDCEQSKKSAWFAIGKTAAKLFRKLPLVGK